jgi:choline dehydrogenase-like flavoprotein
VKEKPNLTVITGATAARILFQEEQVVGDVVAEGIEYSKDGRLFNVHATREVILSAGMEEAHHAHLAKNIMEPDLSLPCRKLSNSSAARVIW